MLSDARPTCFIAATDLARSRAFYTSVLGLTLEHEDGFAVVVRLREATLRISPAGPDLVVQPFTVLGWEVDDIRAEVRSLGGRGVEFLRVDGIEQDELGVWTTPDGSEVAWFTDPDGHTLSLSHH